MSIVSELSEENIVDFVLKRDLSFQYIIAGTDMPMETFQMLDNENRASIVKTSVQQMPPDILEELLLDEA